MLPACLIPAAGQVASNLEAQMPGGDESSLLGHFVMFDTWNFTPLL